MNQVIIMGRISSDITNKQTNSNNTICTFSIVHNKKVKDEERASFFNCVAFGKTADFILKYANRGEAYLFEGELNHNKWTDENNANRNSVNIVINQIKFLLRNKKKESNSGIYQSPETEIKKQIDNQRIEDNVRNADIHFKKSKPEFAKIGDIIDVKETPF